MANPKTFNYRGHRYRIFHIARTEREAHQARSRKFGLSHASFRTAVKQLADGRWAAGAR